MPTIVQVSDMKYPLTTSEFAALNGIKPQSVRVHLCRAGSYFGVIPRKLASGRLAWDAVQVLK